jgi:hypothetical protein
VLLMLGAFRRRDGMVFFLGIGLWAVARAAVATTWRDPAVSGAFNAGGAIAIGIASACVLALVVLIVRSRMTRRDPDAGSAAPAGTARTGGDLAWPDPESRPRF